MRLHLPQTLARVCVPDADHLVVARTSNISTILRELTAGQPLGMTPEFSNLLACIDIPEFNSKVSAAGNNRVPAHLYGVDWATVTSQLFQELASGAVPYTDADVLGARHDVLVIKAKIEHSSGMVEETAYRAIAPINIVYDAGAVGAAGDKDAVVVLEAEDGCVVVGLKGDGRGYRSSALCAGLRTRVRLVGRRVSWVAIFAIQESIVLYDLWRANDKLACQGVHVPDADCLVAGTGDDLLPVDNWSAILHSCSSRDK